MKKKSLTSLIIPTTIIVLIFLFLIFLYFYYFLYSPEKREYLTDREKLLSLKKREYLTNTEELRSLFTDYMKGEVDYHLELLACEPKEYYYDNSSFCFLCEKAHACFGFAWVERTGGKRMNPKSIPYLKTEEIDIKAADFYKYGLASGFQCNKKDKNKLECDKGLIFVKDDLNIKMLITNLDNFEEVSKKICIHFGYDFEKCENLSCRCGEMLITARQEDGEIILVW